MKKNEDENYVFGCLRARRQFTILWVSHVWFITKKKMNEQRGGRKKEQRRLTDEQKWSISMLFFSADITFPLGLDRDYESESDSTLIKSEETSVHFGRFSTFFSTTVTLWNMFVCLVPWKLSKSTSESLRMDKSYKNLLLSKCAGRYVPNFSIDFLLAIFNLIQNHEFQYPLVMLCCFFHRVENPLR